jgi:hypothetical protein
MGSRSRGLGNRIKILVGDPFPFSSKRKSKKGVVATTTNGDTLEEPVFFVNISLGPIL